MIDHLSNQPLFRGVGARNIHHTNLEVSEVQLQKKPDPPVLLALGKVQRNQRCGHGPRPNTFGPPMSVDESSSSSELKNLRQVAVVADHIRLYPLALHQRQSLQGHLPGFTYRVKLG